MRRHFVCFFMSVSTISFANPAFAQETTTDPTVQAEDQIAEIVVTARRREESIQAVPISITALGGDDIASMNISNAVELSRRVPSLAINGSTANSALFTVGIRGMRQASYLAMDDPSVGTIYAESVIAHPYGFGEMMFDIRSVQVLKGPQGTLFGRNTTGGVVSVEPNYARVEDGFSGSIRATLGTYALRQLDTVLNVPLGDVAAVRIAYQHRERGGYSTNLLTGKKWDDINNDAVRASLTLEPTDSLRSTTTFDYLSQHSLPGSVRIVGVVPPGGALQGGTAAALALLAEQKGRSIWKFVNVSGTNGPQDLLAPYRCAGNAASPFQQNCRDTEQPTNDLEAYNVVNNTRLELGDVTLKNIFGYRHVERQSTGQTSFVNSALSFPSGSGNLAITRIDPIKQITNELQLAGRSFDSLNWIVGHFFIKEDGRESSYPFTASGAVVPTSQANSDATFSHISHGLFAQGTWAVADSLRLTLGGRQNWDHRKSRAVLLTTNVVTGAQTCRIFAGPTGPALLPVEQCALVGDKKWSAFTWTASADYDVAPGTMVYGTVSRGYRSGGFFYRALRQNLFGYNPEFATNFEAGIKSDWSLFGRPIRTNLSVYNTNLRGQQLQVSDPTTAPVSGFIANAGRSRYRGFEFETTYRPTASVELTAFASYNGFKYLEYESAGVDLTYQTNVTPITPWSGGASISYQLPIPAGVGEVSLRADIAAFSKVKTNNVNPTVFVEYPQSAYSLVNLRADWRGVMGGPVDVGVWVTNLTNEWYATGLSNLSGASFAAVSPPRMFGVELSYKFGER